MTSEPYGRTGNRGTIMVVNAAELLPCGSLGHLSRVCGPRKGDEMIRWHSLMTMLLIVTPVGAADLLHAIERVESAGKTEAVGDGGKAVGCLQIHPITVDECNRILGKKAYSYDDRKSRAKSHEMFRIITGQWKGETDETIARRWNGGPTGETKKATRKYWLRVKRQLLK